MVDRQPIKSKVQSSHGGMRKKIAFILHIEELEGQKIKGNLIGPKKVRDVLKESRSCCM